MARIKVYDKATQQWVYADKSFGKDGISPTASVEKIDGGSRLTITGKDGGVNIDVKDGSTVVAVDATVSASSANPVQNKAVHSALTSLSNKIGQAEKAYSDLKKDVEAHTNKLSNIADEATRVEKSDTNGKIKINGVDTIVYSARDRVIETGVKSGWSYRRWSTNYAECWKTVTYPVATTDWETYWELSLGGGNSGMPSFGGLDSLIADGVGLHWTSIKNEAGNEHPITFDLPFAFKDKTEVASMTNESEWLPLTLISTKNGDNVNRKNNGEEYPELHTDSYKICTFKIPKEVITVTLYLYVCGNCKNKE